MSKRASKPRCERCSRRASGLSACTTCTLRVCPECSLEVRVQLGERFSRPENFCTTCARPAFSTWLDARTVACGGANPFVGLTGAELWSLFRSRVQEFPSEFLHAVSS